MLELKEGFKSRKERLGRLDYIPVLEIGDVGFKSRKERLGPNTIVARVFTEMSFKSRKERLGHAAREYAAPGDGEVSNPGRNVWDGSGRCGRLVGGALFQIPEGTFGT